MPARVAPSDQRQKQLTDVLNNPWSKEQSMIITIRRFLSGNASRLRKDEKGATAIEYGLIAALISVAIIAGATSLGGTLNSTFNSISTKMTTAKTASDGYAGTGTE